MMEYTFLSRPPLALVPSDGLRTVETFCYLSATISVTRLPRLQYGAGANLKEQAFYQVRGCGEQMPGEPDTGLRSEGCFKYPVSFSTVENY